MKKVVLAFSGGLDTSYCAIYLAQELGLEIYTAIVDTGGFSEEELKDVERRAYAMGAKQHTHLDETENFYNTCIRYLVYGNVLKNNVYPLSVSAERVTQALAIANYAKSIGADAVAHGSTGAGNDQVRFDMIFQAIIPEVEIITPIRDKKLSREQEIEYLKEHGVEMDFKKAQYSINKGIWGTSVGGKETLTSNLPLPEAAYPTQLSKQEPERVTLHFDKGELTGINGETFAHPVQAIQHLQELAAPFAIGRDIHVGDTIIGIKGRVGFEAAAPMVIIKAHHTLEKHVLTKWQLYWKDQLSAWYGNWLHEGQLLDPTMRDIEAFLESTQKNVTGDVHVLLAPYRFQVEGIESAHDLMSDKFGSYGEMNRAWTSDDVKGFAKIFGNQTKMYHSINSDEAWGTK
ncbi:argininosuccinate synthase [Pontibacter sp. E15-1]|uniref:argininosuccinate synthase n=1 Tax=Pontibacter sp. E15-1 TaxID=2919918 RepID=UPI001F4F78B2|nr:argininosuccinate synthase [Pontibacter sp. E15-1]MCJ8163641.1 argininosuccinate synthase [Pontibacter sp. E15-1]